MCDGDNYYRLIEVDFDGKKETFPSQYIYCNREMSFILYPNPTADILNIEFQKTQEGLVFIYLYDSTGKVIYDNAFYGDSHKINMNCYSPGEYVLILKNDESSVVKKIVKL